MAWVKVAWDLEDGVERVTVLNMDRVLRFEMDPMEVAYELYAVQGDGAGETRRLLFAGEKKEADSVMARIWNAVGKHHPCSEVP